MADSSCNVTGLLKRASELLNNKLFSDVQIQVKDGSNYKTFPAHKLFLAMGSQEFANIFYNKSDSPSFIKIFDYKPETVYLMLKYLYTTKLDLRDMEEARELYTLSKKFGIRNLQEFCVDYISKDEINKDNVLHMYECALREKFTRLLINCRNIVSLNTKTVFESPSFVEASEDVIIDIFQLNTLGVDSELDILHAAMKWARYECKRKRLPYDSLCMRQCMKNIFRHIRFLALRVDELSDFVEKHDILTAHESFVITRKLLQPQSKVSVPPGFCEISTPRSSFQEESLSSTSEPDSEVKSVNMVRPSSATSKRHQVIRPSLRSNTVAQLRSRNSLPRQSLNLHINNNQNSTLKIPQIQLPKRNLDFPLENMQKLMSTAFENDVKCTASIHMLKGVIIIHGVELKINQMENAEETIKMYLNITLSGEKPINNVHQELLKQSTLALKFYHPIKVIENNSVDIEIIIEDLKLNRCNVIKNPICELTCENGITANVALTSNQMSESGEYFFLIQRLNYSPV